MHTHETECPEDVFSERIRHVPPSFLREILKLTSSKEIISFAGGLPDPSCFPSEKLKEAAIKALTEEASHTLQYSVTEGFLPLRELVADMYYRQFGLQVKPSEILITNGSQQGLDLLGKIFIDPGDNILIENPGYLGALQAFGLYQPRFIPVNLHTDGPDLDALESLVKMHKIKMMYAIPDFQNPTGCRWSPEKRQKTAEILTAHNILVAEDNPYGEINFSGHRHLPMKSLILQRGILLGTFSKTISPGLRIGWMVAEEKILKKLVIAKQASDLHTNVLAQKIIYHYIREGNYNDHLAQIRESYRSKKECMLQAIRDYFPEEVRYSDPEGGMFVWVTLPEYMDASGLLKKCIDKYVAFVPGKTFYPGEGGHNTLRLNYSNSSFEEIQKGIRILGSVIRDEIL